MFRFLGEAMLNQDCWLLHHSRSYGFYAQQHEAPEQLYGNLLEHALLEMYISCCCSCLNLDSQIKNLSDKQYLHPVTTFSPPFCHSCTILVLTLCLCRAVILCLCGLSLSLLFSVYCLSISGQNRQKQNGAGFYLSARWCLKTKQLLLLTLCTNPQSWFSCTNGFFFFFFPLNVVRLFDLKKCPTEKAISSQVCHIKIFSIFCWQLLL